MNFIKEKLFYYLVVVMLISLVSCGSSKSWQTASRESAGIAPLPEETHDAIVHIYKAPVWGIRGKFADHTWIATKKNGASNYTVYQSVGWNKYTAKDALEIKKDIPDRFWYGNKPKIIFQLQGKAAEPIVDKIKELAQKYPYKSKYAIFPGPNSNTFTAWMICQIPELDLKLSSRAIGKNYLKECGSS